MSRTNKGGPQFIKFFGPVVAALNQLGGSRRPSEVQAAVVESLRIPEADLANTMSSGASRNSNQLDWARFYLAKAGCTDASRLAPHNGQ